MRAKLVLCLLTAAVVVAAAKSYSMELYRPALVGTTELKAGEYQVQVVNQTAVLTSGRMHVQSAITVGTSDKKYVKTSVVLDASKGTPKIQEIHLGGTTTKLLFTE